MATIGPKKSAMTLMQAQQIIQDNLTQYGCLVPLKSSLENQTSTSLQILQACGIAQVEFNKILNSKQNQEKNNPLEVSISEALNTINLHYVQKLSDPAPAGAPVVTAAARASNAIHRARAASTPPRGHGHGARAADPAAHTPAAQPQPTTGSPTSKKPRRPR